jgi:hypothetical protein
VIEENRRARLTKGGKQVLVTATESQETVEARNSGADVARLRAASPRGVNKEENRLALATVLPGSK